MAQVSQRRLSPKRWNQVFHLFLRALTEARNENQAEGLVASFLTPTEKVMLAKRFALFFLIEKGLPTREIASELKISTATVVRWRLFWLGADSQFKKLVKKIMVKKEVANLLTDLFKGIYYGSPLPPPTNWRVWTKGKNRWRKELTDPLR